MANDEKELDIPIWLKANLTVEEAAAYTGIGMNKLRELSDSDACLQIKKLEEVLENAFSI